MPNNERKLKILPKFFRRSCNHVVFPEIRLSGKWLQELGFLCGHSVTITHTQNSITITVIPQEIKEPVIKNKPNKKAAPLGTAPVINAKDNPLAPDALSQPFQTERYAETNQRA